MLVLTRKKLESLLIGDNIEVTVLGVQGNRVRLGIQAPDGVGIRRGEVTLEAWIDEPNDELPIDRTHDAA